MAAGMEFADQQARVGTQWLSDYSATTLQAARKVRGGKATHMVRRGAGHTQVWGRGAGLTHGEGGGVRPHAR